MNSDDKGEESSGSGSAVTVILLDEADIVFDSESGFWSTVMELAIKSKSDSQCDTDGSHASCVFILLIVGAHPISAVASKQAYCTLHPTPSGVNISSSSSIHRTLFLLLRRDRCCYLYNVLEESGLSLGTIIR